MSEDNLERLRLILQQLFQARRVDPELLAADVEWVNPPEAVEPGTRTGAESFNRAIANVFAAWDDVRFETEHVIGVDSPHGQIWTFRDGRVTRMRWVNSHREALEAAGLPRSRRTPT